MVASWNERHQRKPHKVRYELGIQGVNDFQRSGFVVTVKTTGTWNVSSENKAKKPNE